MNSFRKALSITLSFCVAASICGHVFATETHKKHKIKKTKATVSKQAKQASAPALIYGSQNLTAVIDNVINSIDPALNIGIAVKSMKHGDMLYVRNPHRSFVPASIMKIATAEAALIYLGANYKFETSFFTDASRIENGVIYGNLYLVHSGDPTLTYRDLIELMDMLKARQIRQVMGNVYIDTTAYDQVNYGPGWIWDDKRYCYAAPISASIINHNCLSFQVAPGSNVGHPANIIQSPHVFSAIQNSVVTSNASTRSCYLRLGTNPDSSISVTGCMPRGRYVQGVTTVIGDIVEYNKSLLRTLFRRSGIQVLGNIASGAAPARLTLLATHQSKPLSELLTTMLKKSDNVIAGSVFKKLGETYSKQPGSWENGSLAVSRILQYKAGVNTTNMNVLDGSGLSRYNQISPAQMLQILDFAYHNNATNYDFIYGLPVAGIDGTLKHRLSNIAWRVRAKTGTIKGVNALAGYAVTPQKEALAFVIIVNGKLGLGWQYKDLEDKIVTAIAKYSR